MFDPRGTVAFPRRVEVLGSVHGNQIFGLAHANLSAPVRITPAIARGLNGFTTQLPSGKLLFISPRKTTMLADATATLHIDGFTSADEVFESAR